MQQLLTDRYYRFTTELTIGNDDLDDASATNLFALKTLAANIIRDNDQKIDKLCQELVK